MNSIKKVFFIFMVLLFFSIASFSQERENGGIYELDGKGLFIQKRCARCHTLGRGVFVGPDLLLSRERYSKDELLSWIINPQWIYKEKGKQPVNDGFPPMPTLEVTPAEAEKLADFILSFDKEGVDLRGGSIEGVVVNASDKDSKLSGVRVTLISYLGEKNLETYSRITDDNGFFEFDNLPWNRSYEVSIGYEGNLYATEKMVFPPDQNKVKLTLPVYEATGDASSISISHYHIILRVENDKVSLAEIIDVANKGNKIYSGHKTMDKKKVLKEVISFPLPENATAINFLEGVARENLVVKNNLITDTTPIAPGIRRIAFTYLLPLQERNTVIKRTSYLPVEKYTVLVEDSESGVQIKGLEHKSDITIGDKIYAKWEGKGSLKTNQGYGIEILIKKSYLNKYLLLKTLPLVIFSVFIIATVIVARRKA